MQMSGKFALLGCLFVIIRISEGIPLESTTVKILVPPPAAAVSDDSDAIVIDASDSDDATASEDGTDEGFNSADCLLPKAKGPCRAAIDAWFYSPVTKNCEKFSWSGCGGNNNRFSEKAFCETHCSKDKLTGLVTSHSQNLKAKPTTFPVLIPQAQANSGGNSSITGNCPDFDGCGPLKCAVSKDPVTGCQKCECSPGPNGPDDDTVEVKLPIGSVSGNPDVANVSDKPGKPEDVCHLPETRGNCRAMMTRWRYNAEIKECVQFHFGGCDGNTNNFVSKEKCAEFCKGQ